MDEIQDIEMLKRRYDEMRDKKTEAETKLATAKEELARLQVEARERFGTDNLEELKGKLAQMEADNLKKRKEYQALLDGIERDLKQVEEQVDQG